MPRLFTMDDNSTPNMQHDPPNSHAQMQRMQSPAPFHPFMNPNGAQMRPTEGRNSNTNIHTGPPSTSHTMFANQLQPYGRAQAVPLNPRGLSPFEFKRAAQAQAQLQAQATRNSPPGPVPAPLPSGGNYHHGSAPSTTMGSPSSAREQQAQVPSTMGPPLSSVRQQQAQASAPPPTEHQHRSSEQRYGGAPNPNHAQTSAPRPMEHQHRSEQRYGGILNQAQASDPPPMEHQRHNEQRYGGVPNNNPSWSHYPGNQQQQYSQHHPHQQRMMYQDPYGRGTPYHPNHNPSNHSYSHPYNNNNNNRRSSFPAPQPPPPPAHAFHRPNGRSSNPKMHPPNRRFTFNAITAPNKLMEQHNQNQAASRSPSPMGIPAPPSFESSVPTSMNQQNPKHHDSMASNQKVKDSEHQELQAPLRESRHQNVHVPLQPTMREQRVDHVSTPGGKKAPVSTGGSTNVDTASILLELRTSNSSSPVATTDIHGNENNSISTVKTTNATTSENKEHEDSPPTKTTNLVPKNYPKRLALEDDDNKLNTLHCFIRSELLEIFVVDQTICSSPPSAAGSGSALGRVGLRCVHCAQERRRLKVSDRNEAPMAVFYPKCVSEIYRLITSWQRCHLRKCRNLPPKVREQWDELRKEDRSRGKTAYWVTSATQLGLVDCQSKGRGVRFSAEMMTEHNEERI